VILFQDRMTGVLEVNLASISNRLNQIMKVLTVMSTIFLPLTVLTGMWGMNIDLPHLPGGAGAQFLVDHGHHVGGQWRNACGLPDEQVDLNQLPISNSQLPRA
jgi:hypothetical protein